MDKLSRDIERAYLLAQDQKGTDPVTIADVQVYTDRSSRDVLLGVTQLLGEAQERDGAVARKAQNKWARALRTLGR